MPGICLGLGAYVRHLFTLFSFFRQAEKTWFVAHYLETLKKKKNFPLGLGLRNTYSLFSTSLTDGGAVVWAPPFRVTASVPHKWTVGKIVSDGDFSCLQIVLLLPELLYPFLTPFSLLLAVGKGMADCCNFLKPSDTFPYFFAFRRYNLLYEAVETRLSDIILVRSPWRLPSPSPLPCTDTGEAGRVWNDLCCYLVCHGYSFFFIFVLPYHINVVAYINATTPLPLSN